MFNYNPLNPLFNNKGGSAKFNEEISIKVESDSSFVELIIYDDKNANTIVYPLNWVGNCFAINFKLNVGLYFYYFKTNSGFYGKDDFLNSKFYSDEALVQKFQLSIYKSSYKTPNWLKGGFIYQIFPDRFNKSTIKEYKQKPIMRAWGEMPFYKPNEKGKILNNDFFGGNFKGIEEKLDYLKGLGVNVIYLNPISLSYSNHRYDTSDYLKLDYLLGDESDFKDLVNSAHKKGIKIIIDGVYNHTGDDSVYFNKYNNFESVGAYQSKKSKYYDWYSFQEYPDLYTSWWGIDVLPTINKNSKDFENFILDKVFEKYFSFGVDGVRLDVVDELPTPFVKKIRKKIKKLNPNASIIGEVWEDATNKIAYSSRREYFLGDELDSVMNYPLKNALINYLLTGDTRLLAKTTIEQINNYPNDALLSLMNILGTHDTPRIISVLSGKNFPNDREGQALFKLSNAELNLAKERLMLALCFMFTIYGTISLYYGDECLMQGLKDPFNRQCMDFANQDESVLKLIKKLAKIRSESDAIKLGKTEILDYKNGIFAFARTYNSEEILVVLNASNTSYEITANNYINLLEKTSDKYSLDKYSYLILKRR